MDADDVAGSAGAGDGSPSPDPAMPRAGRLLGIDWGERHIGIAVSDPAQTVSHPVSTLTRRTGRRFPMKQLRPILEEYQPVGVVVGLPLEANGTAGRSATQARALGTRLTEVTGLPVAYWDERMSTAQVRKAMAQTGSTGRTGAQIDQLAATVILQHFLQRRGDG